MCQSLSDREQNYETTWLGERGGGRQRFDLVTFTVSYCCGNICIDSLAYTILLWSMFQYVVDFVDSGASDYQEHPLGCYKMGLSF